MNCCLRKGSDQKSPADLLLSESKYQARKGADFQDLPVPASIEFLDLPREVGLDRFPEEIQFFDQSILLRGSPSICFGCLAHCSPDEAENKSTHGKRNGHSSRVCLTFWKDMVNNQSKVSKESKYPSWFGKTKKCREKREAYL
jgi:hypothetical protein